MTTSTTIGLVLLLAGTVGPLVIMGYLSDFTVEKGVWIWWVHQLSRDRYTPDGQRRLLRWRPLIFLLLALQLVGAVMLL